MRDRETPVSQGVINLRTVSEIANNYVLYIYATAFVNNFIQFKQTLFFYDPREIYGFFTHLLEGNRWRTIYIFFTFLLLITLPKRT